MNAPFRKLLVLSASTLVLLGGILGGGVLRSQGTSAIVPVQANPLHNVLRLAPGLVSGSGPEGEAGFETLWKLGIKTVISVDGARPHLEGARKFGLRYVHVPIGYDGIPRDRALLLHKALTEMPGPIYIHCHHGKHRGPAAAAVGLLCLDDKCGVDQALKVLHQAGTDPRYVGLFESVRKFRRPSKQEIAALPARLPEVVRAAAFTEAMVHLDHHWDNLKLIRKAGWMIPATHPDLDPPHEALQVVEHYREMARLKEVAARPVDFRGWLTEGASKVEQLEKLLRVGKKAGSVEAAAAEKAFVSASQVCTRCHATYRDRPLRGTP